MKLETLRFDEKDDITYITLNRPDRLNSFDLKLGEELYSVLKDSGKKANIRAVVIKGTGKGFCGGGDVKEMYEAKGKSQFLGKLTKVIHKCVIEMRKMEKPVIGSMFLLFKSLSWAEKRKVFNRLHETMEKKPESEKHRFYKRNIGSILTAYREGDVSFESAVSLLSGLKKKRQKGK